MERPITPDVRESILALVEYLWRDEAKHWEASGRPAAHIFRHVERVSAWLGEEA